MRSFSRYSLRVCAGEYCPRLGYLLLLYLLSAVALLYASPRKDLDEVIVPRLS